MILRFAWILVLLASMLPAAALAQDDTGTAVELAQKAKAEYDVGNWSAALRLFESAEQKAHSPVLLLYAARCNRNLGKLLRARAILRQVADEPLGADASEPFRAAQKDATADLAALEPRIPTIAIDRTRMPDTWRVQVDGVAVDEASIAVDPGSHVVRAGAGQAVEFEQKVDIEEAASITVSVVEQARTEPDGPPDPQPDPDAPPSDAAAFAVGFTLLGVGVAALAVGVGTRVAAVKKVSDVKDRCVANSCLAEDAQEIEKAETLQTVSTVLFVVGGAVAATGIVLLIVLPGSGDNKTALHLGPAHLGLSGTF